MLEDFPEGHFGHLSESAFEGAAIKKKADDAEESSPPLAKKAKPGKAPPGNAADGEKEPSKSEVVQAKPLTSSNAVTAGCTGGAPVPAKDEVEEEVDEHGLLGYELGDDDMPGEGTQEELDEDDPCFGEPGQDAMTALRAGSPTAGLGWWSS